MFIPQPYLIFIGDEASPQMAKTGLGVAHWAPEKCVGQWLTAATAIDLGLPAFEPREAVAAGARSLLIGVSPIGGRLPAAWHAPLVQALEAGLDIVSGLHDRLSTVAPIADAARRTRRNLFDVRQTTADFPIATGRKRSGKRLLTVGTDCALGKKYTALALTRAMQAAGIDADFRATGQTGMMIAGRGIPIDAVIADFIAGAAETLSPDGAADHWDVIEGQGAILHPAYAGVTLGLLHGSQPDALVLCHDPRRLMLNGFPNCPVSALELFFELYLGLAQVTNSQVHFVGIAINTLGIDDATALRMAEELEQRHRLPCCDPIRFGIEKIVSSL